MCCSKFDFVECPNHKLPGEIGNSCQKCLELKKCVKDFQTHKHTFSCQKKNKLMTIRENEGHGKDDNRRRGHRINNFVQCRYRFPQFPINKTKFILGMPKELTVEETERRKKDLQKIKKYLIRQTLSEDSTNKPTMELTKFNNLKFLEFLYEVGMFSTDKKLEEYSNKEAQ